MEIDDAGVPERPPWGAFRPGGVAGALLRLSRSVPDLPLLGRAAFPVRRLARRLMGPTVDARLWGFRLRLRARGNLAEGRLLFFPERWDPAERAYLRRRVQPGAAVVDVGANAGGYTWWALHLTGGNCSVLAVEPDPELRSLFAFNLATNGVDVVRVSGDAVGSGEGEATLRIHRSNRGQNRLLPDEAGVREAAGAREAGVRGAAGGDDSVRVRVRTLLDLVGEAGFRRIDLLKIDIEGLEPPVLDAFFRDAPLELWPRTLVVEDGGSAAHRTMKSGLEARGYRLACTTPRNLAYERAAEPGD